MSDYRDWNRKPTHRIVVPNEIDDLRARVELLERYLKDECDTVYELKTLEDLDSCIKDIREQMLKSAVVRVTLER